MAQSDFSILFDCWRSLPRREGAKAPSRRYLRTDRIGNLLPRISINERLSRYELMQIMTGKQIEDEIDLRIVGRNLFDLYSGAREREILADFVETVLGFPCGGHMVRLITRPDGFPYTLSTFHLPMEDDDGNLSMMLGIVSATPSRGDEQRVLGDTFHYRLKSIDYIDIGHGTPMSKPHNPKM